MTLNSDSWDDVDKLAVGGHVHLDRLVESPPPPGSRDWVPIVHELVASLVERGGNWLVTVPVGTGLHISQELPTAKEVFDHVNVTELREPPAVYRAGDKLVPNTWEGEYYARKRVIAPSVTEIVSFGRSSDTPADEPGFSAQIAFEVRNQGPT
jgi:hypothetical protein